MSIDFWNFLPKIWKGRILTYFSLYCMHFFINYSSIFWPANFISLLIFWNSKLSLNNSVVLLVLICLLKYNENSLVTNANIDKTIGWGIKRATNNMQPDVGSSNKKILEDNGGICLGKDTEKVIYLTFDEGYEAGYTENILNISKQNDIKATFFITAH